MADSLHSGLYSGRADNLTYFLFYNVFFFIITVVACGFDILNDITNADILLESTTSYLEVIMNCRFPEWQKTINKCRVYK